MIEKLKGKVIVSCQALEDEPLHSSFIMSKMALAAKAGEPQEFAPIQSKIFRQSKKYVTCLLLALLKETILILTCILLQLIKKSQNY